ncbi:MAG: sodium-translocating pyrophosphatase, partial [Bacteroidota bacterium]|nr:sodium-translocating pyrophosphatase [Bacteroidota bacterium]
MKKVKFLAALLFVFAPAISFASEADLVIPDGVKDQNLLYWGFLVTFAGFMFGLYQFMRVKKIRAHQSMLDVAHVIFETAKTYLIQQGKFLIILFLFVGTAVAFYFGYLSDAHFGIGGVSMILGWTVIGILGY